MSVDPQNNDTHQKTTEKPFIRYDDYWLQKGRQMIDGSIETLTNRLTNLNNFLNYLAAGTFLSGISITTYLQSANIGVYWLVAIPLIFIGIAKFFISVGATTPDIETTDMRSPTQINENYAQILIKLSKKVKKASQWVAISTGFTLALLPFAVYLHNCEQQVEIPKTYLSIQDEGSVLSLEGILPTDTKTINLILYGKDGKKNSKTPIYTDILPIKPGIINATISLDKLNIVLDSVDINYVSKNIIKQNTYRFKKENTKASSVKKEENKKKENDSTKTTT